MHRILCSIVLLAAVSSGAVLADTATVIFQPQGGGGVAPYKARSPGDEGIDTWFGTVYSTSSQATCSGVEEPINCQHLKVGGWADMYYSFIRFRLSCMPRVATSAIISLYSFPHPAGFTPTPMRLEVIATSWEEGTISSLPAFRPGLSFNTPAPEPGSWYDIPITDLYNAWRRGDYPNHGLVMIPLFNNRNSNLFRSSDFPNPVYRPKLTVTYDTTQQGSGSSFSLCFPLRHDVANDQYTARIASVFDHSMTTAYAKNGRVTAMTGDSGTIGYTDPTDPTNFDPTCMQDSAGTSYLRRGVKNGRKLNYQGAQECGGKAYLSYDGHPGIDYPVPRGTPVYAAIDGTISRIECQGVNTCTVGRDTINSVDYNGRICIRHSSGYVLGYLHLNRQVGTLILGTSVKRGQLIGYVGGTGKNGLNHYSPHLHVEVRKNRNCIPEPGKSVGQATDPYGWWNTQPDPFIALNGAAAVNSWLWDE